MFPCKKLNLHFADMFFGSVTLEGFKVITATPLLVKGTNSVFIIRQLLQKNAHHAIINKSEVATKNVKKMEKLFLFESFSTSTGYTVLHSIDKTLQETAMAFYRPVYQPNRFAYKT